MNLETLTALYPIAREILARAPQSKGWMERKARREDPAFLLQIQSLQAISELWTNSLTTDIMSALLSNPALTSQQIKEKFLVSGEVARDILTTIEHIAP